MKTAKIELSYHMNIDLQAGIYDTKTGNEVWKITNFIFFKI